MTTLLLVDDDSSVRDSLAKVLRAKGYRVLLAANGQQALDRFARGGIDLLILDLGLPRKSGWDVFERITTKNPFVPVIIITGQARQLDTAVAAGVGALMEKPLDVEQLLETIRRLLAEPKETRLRRLSGYRKDVHYVPPHSF
jgi:two-component system, OmpR family, response regulator RegX3